MRHPPPSHHHHDGAPGEEAEAEGPAQHLLSLLRDGDRCLAEARLSLRRAARLKEALHEEGQGLFDVLGLMTQQCQAIARLLHWAWAANDRLARRLARLLTRDEPFVYIDHVCRRLEQTPVAAELVAGEAGHTLFDFVDDASLASLKLQAQADLKEMLALHEKGGAAQAVLEERLLYFQRVLRTLQDGLGAAVTVAEAGTEEDERGEEEGGGGLSVRRVLLPTFEACGLWRAVAANVAEQEAIVEGMKAGLLAAASAYSRLTVTTPSNPAALALAPAASDAPASPAVDPAAEERALLALLQASINRMKELHLEMDGLPPRVHGLRQRMAALLADFESFPPEAGERVASLQADRGRFQGLATEVEGHLQELASLAAFYSHFAAAYAALGPEAGRRRAYLGRVARVALECQQRLDALRAEEEAERARFRSAHGRYLPASLCPVIQEPPQRFAVRPDAKEVLARLPSVNTTGGDAGASALMASPSGAPSLRRAASGAAPAQPWEQDGGLASSSGGRRIAIDP